MSQSIKLIAGLGNPGSQYARTRHNVGFWFIDAIARSYAADCRYQRRFDCDLGKVESGGQSVWLMKPGSFVNDSGRPLRAVTDYYGISPGQTLIVYDELELEPGQARLRVGGGHGGHNGVRDIVRHLGKQDCVRLRIGIGRPTGKSKVAGWVLSRAPRTDELRIDAAISAALNVLPDLVAGKRDCAIEALQRQTQN